MENLEEKIIAKQIFDKQMLWPMDAATKACSDELLIFLFANTFETPAF